MEKKLYIAPQTAVHTVSVEQAMLGASEALTWDPDTDPQDPNDEGENQYLAW